MNTLVLLLNSGRGLLQAVFLKSHVAMLILLALVAQWKFSMLWKGQLHSESHWKARFFM